MKCATVAIIGRPSSGKSTLINTICERKVSITASSPQTTRNAIRGIYTDQRGQLILTDTPGFHMSEQKMNLRLQETTISSLKDSDAILYVVDPKRVVGKEEMAISQIIKASAIPVVIAINKSDISSAKEMADSQKFLEDVFPQSPILIVSAKLDEGVDEVLIKLFTIAPEGDLLYPEEAYTDQPIEFRIEEIIREKAITSLSDELPHAIYVELADIEYNQESEEIWIRAFIIVERDSQKGIVVGKGGEGIKNIRKAAFKEIKQLFPKKRVQLDLRVKAQPKWRKNTIVLDRIL